MKGIHLLQTFRFRYGWVLGSQLLLLFGYPLCASAGLPPGILALFLALVLVATIRATLSSRCAVAGVTLLGGGAILLDLAQVWVAITWLDELSNLLFVAFFLVATIAMLRYTLESERVTFDKITAAFCVYFFIAMFWAMAYQVLEEVHPGSFAFSGAVLSAGESAEFFVYLYYSLVTVTTLGYGDITPVTAFGQSLAASEALVGQIYITVLVARLVALHIAHSQPDAAG